MDRDDPTCPVRRQVIPTHHELENFTSMMEDSLAEDKHSPVPGLVHRYPDRVLMLVTTQCASYRKGSGWKAHGFNRGMQNPGRPKGGVANA